MTAKRSKVRLFTLPIQTVHLNGGRRPLSRLRHWARAAHTESMLSHFSSLANVCDGCIQH